MMKKNILFFALLIPINVFSAALDCKAELFSSIYRLETNQNLSTKDSIRSSTCDPVVLNKITQLISSSNGTTNSEIIKNELQRDFPGSQFEIAPRKISLLDLNTFLREKLTTQSNLYFLDSKSLNGLTSLGLTEGEQVKFTCESCTSFGEKNIKVDIFNSNNNNSRSLWFTSKILAKIKVFKAKRNLSFQQKHLVADDFYADEILVNNPENILSTLENIQFYKANKTILQDSVVTNLDIQSVNLITFGTPVNVELKNQRINLQRTALPTRSALFGDTIELKNPINNKIISGKVVDYNKVVIEL